MDIHSSDTEHQGSEGQMPRTVNPADGDEADGGDEIEAVEDGSATRTSMQMLARRRARVTHATASDLNLGKSEIRYDYCLLVGEIED